MPQTTRERQREIREIVESMSVTRPESPDEGLWYGVRDDPNYYRYTTDEVDVEGPLYDVWLNAETSRNRYGNLEVTIEVVTFDCQAWHRVDEQMIYSGTFDGHQPTEQAFLLNAHHYERQAQEAFDAGVESAEYWARNDEEFFR
jgi:hypothetical protein